jgi:hypothetical protein
MDLRVGFTLEDPPVTIPWTVTVADLRRLMDGRLREVTLGYFTATCRSLGGMEHELGFHFVPRGGDRLDELEFFRRSYADRQASFEEFQRHFEAAFGPPHRTGPGTEGFPSHEWTVSGATIVHFVIDRFGPEEHLRIRRLTS